MTQQSADGRRLKTADNLLNIIEYIEGNGGAGVSEIADEIGLAKSTVHEYLYTLVDREYLINNSGVYELSLRFFGHGVSSKERYDFLPVAEPILTKLAEETGGGVAVIVEEHGKGVVIQTARGEHAVESCSNNRLGHCEHLHCQASGKVMLAQMSEERVHEIIDLYGLPKKTSNTITDRNKLLDELAEIRKKGYAVNDEEVERKVKAIAIPILLLDDEIVGALAIDGPAGWMDRMNFETNFPAHLLSAVDEIMLRYNWDTSSQ